MFFRAFVTEDPQRRSELVQPLIARVRRRQQNAATRVQQFRQLPEPIGRVRHMLNHCQSDDRIEWGGTRTSFKLSQCKKLVLRVRPPGYGNGLFIEVHTEIAVGRYSLREIPDSATNIEDASGAEVTTGSLETLPPKEWRKESTDLIGHDAPR